MASRWLRRRRSWAVSSKPFWSIVRITWLLMPGKERPFGNENSAAGMSVLRKPQFPPLPQTVLFRFAEDGDWSFSKLAYAKCPKCLGLQLTTWDLKHYRLTFWRNLCLTFGAHPYRCEGCRCNFLSFRPCAAGSMTALTDKREGPRNALGAVG